MNRLYRDDDINVYTNAYLFKELHKFFISRKQVHTVAVVMKDLWENHALFWYLATAPYLEVGLHGWEHKDYSTLSFEECLAHLKKSLDYWQENATRMLVVDNLPEDKKIRTFFAPWNRESQNIKDACQTVGLKFCSVQKGIWENYKIKSFHWWARVMKEKFYV